MKIAVIGLGKMGEAIAYRLHQAGKTVIGYDPAAATRKQVVQEVGITVVNSIQDLAEHTPEIFWLMVPWGDPVQQVINQLTQSAVSGVPIAQAGSIIIDGGNSNFHDSIKHAEYLARMGISFLDCGSSGGVHARDLGFSLMIGGDIQAFRRAEPFFQAIAAPGGYVHVGPSGTGHYVKMVHNGIEYGLLQAYAEGFDLIKNGHFKDADIDLAALSASWQQGSIVRSWILQLAHNVFKKDQKLDTVAGDIGENATGQWTVEEAHKQNIPVRVIEESLAVRAWSRISGGNYGTKVVALLRNQFGGHAFKTKK